MSRALAMADILAAASSTDIIGVDVVINGQPYVASKAGLTVEESRSPDSPWLTVEGFRISMNASALDWKPPVGSWLNVDGRDYEVVKSTLSGSLLSMTMTRAGGSV